MGAFYTDFAICQDPLRIMAIGRDGAVMARIAPVQCRLVQFDAHRRLPFATGTAGAATSVAGALIVLISSILSVSWDNLA
ncbi:hypothetical protein SAMN06295998_13128 [Primorskyibacter flagellatus]|uniref:Uncharacterized protein n=1 Tax=Primorskyibacter flagellatus TaxID=1387277 RepID=A0A1W2EK51_9RHOB|nr:hypothetical protein SAMN06295998_13128 [Primorskyibacter flagellatus]